MKQKKDNKAFTLVEVLLVLVILGVILLIAVPSIFGIIKNSKKNTFYYSVELLVRTIDMDLNNKAYEYEYTYNITDGEISNLDIKVENTKGLNGYIVYDEDANKEYAINNGIWCVRKNKDMNESEIIDYEQGKCVVPGTVTDVKDVIFEDATYTYNGTEKKLEVSKLPDGFTVTYTGNTGTNAGTYDATAVITGNNETITKTATLTINKANVTVIAEDKSSVYGETLATLSSKVTSGTVYGNDNLNITLTKETGNDVGSYNITISASNSNYTITKKNGTYTIFQKTLTESDLGSLTFSDATYTYNKTQRTITVSNLPTGFTVAYTGNTGTNAGTYNATATITGNSNYTGTITKTATLTINKADVTITANNKKSVEGSSLATLTYTTSGTIYSGDNLNISLTKASGTSVGTYTITVSANNANYNITKVNGTYVIGKNLFTYINNLVPSSGNSVTSGTGIIINTGSYGTRYQGSSPNNYVYFNCSDYANPSTSTCELWRIIGIVDGKVKLVRDQVFDDTMPWDYDCSSGSNCATNDWSTATLQIYLNGTYYNSLNNKNSQTGNIISPSTWYLRGHDSNYITKATMYNHERTTGAVYGSYPTSISNLNIGLMYPSDLAFASQEDSSCTADITLYNYYENADDNSCIANNWLLPQKTSSGTIINNVEFTITHNPSNYYFVWETQGDDGYIGPGLNANNSSKIRPVLYLASDVLFYSGDGSLSSPYRLY